MEFLGTKFSITLGAWRLRFVFALEEARDERTRAPQRSHHLRVPRDTASTR